MKKYLAVYKGGSGEIIEKKSRFIAHVENVESVGEAQEFIELMKKEYWDARHNCYAFSVGTDQPVTRCSDDGEPSGTGGKPILEVIQGSGIRNIVIVVTRYFGGTLLGTGGLVRAYTDAARAGIEGSEIIEKIPGYRADLHMDYGDVGKVQYLLVQNDIVTESTDFTDKVVIHSLIPEDHMELMRKKLVEVTSGRIRIETGETVYFANSKGQAIIF